MRREDVAGRRGGARRCRSHRALRRGAGVRQPGLDPHPSAPDTIRDWAARLQCPVQTAARATKVDLDPRLPGPETTIESHRCPRGVAELWTVHGGGHRLFTPALVTRLGAFLTAHPKQALKPLKRR